MPLFPFFWNRNGNRKDALFPIYFPHLFPRSLFWRERWVLPGNSSNLVSDPVLAINRLESTRERVGELPSDIPESYESYHRKRRKGNISPQRRLRLAGKRTEDRTERAIWTKSERNGTDSEKGRRFPRRSSIDCWSRWRTAGVKWIREMLWRRYVYAMPPRSRKKRRYFFH